MLDSEAKEFEIAYMGQEVAVDYVTMELTNQRQKVSPESSGRKTQKPENRWKEWYSGQYAQEDIKKCCRGK